MKGVLTLSKFTTQVRYICESYAGREAETYDGIQEIIELAIPKIFSNYPIFDENYRGELNKKILTHFYNMEIGFETVGLWKLKLNTKMFEIMPYYNQLYKSALLEFDPLKNFDYSRTEEVIGESTGRNSGTNTGTTNTEQTTENNTEQTDYRMYSDTPSGGLDVVEGVEIEGNEYQYLTNLTKNTGKGKVEQNGTGRGTTEGSYTDNSTANNKIDREEIVTGKQGTDSYSKLLKEYRETMLNIDMLIIKDLDSLFFGLWE